MELNYMIKDTKQLMKKYEIRAIKSLGQNFLINQQIIRDIIIAGDVNEADGIIEIGPGMGAMTVLLGSLAAEVIAVEIDRQMILPLKEVLVGMPNVYVINEDILKVDMKGIIDKLKQNPKVKRIKVIANLPYYITTPVIMRLLELENHEIDMMEFMVQKEVAERMCADPGGKDYGALTLAVNYHSTPKIVMNVGAENFIPQPSVDSSVIRLDILSSPPAEILNKTIFFKTVKAAFSQRRKTLLNALGSSGVILGGKTELSKILSDLNINEKIRGEALSLSEFAKISNIISSTIN
jgi:16S rRNA (adenine1518-N6/adenine1519-N6)-dimethyltransferase